MKFKYKAKGSIDEEVEGTINAISKEDALNILWEKGLFPLDIIPQEGATLSGKSLPVKNRSFLKPVRKRITTQHVLVFTRKLATIVRAKVELLAALKIVYEHTEHPAFREIIFHLYSVTKEGGEFSESLRNYPKIFSTFYVNMIKTGETTGRLDVALDQVCAFIRRKEGLRKKVVAALAYPAVLLFVGFASIFILINFVIPRLRFMFETLGDELPLITKIIFQVSDLSNRTWWLVGGVGLIVFLVLYAQKGSFFFREFFRRCRLAIPIVRDITKNQELAYFSNSMGTLLKSGVPALKALTVTIPGVESPKLRRELGDVLDKVSDGKSFHEGFNGVTALPGFFVRMVAVGEESGRLTDVFDELANSYDEQVESDIKILSSLIEPILILFLGVIMGAIVISILIPMFQITQLVE